ncbi:hypothetical protein DFH09DRAFT_1339115 [Mycena vulgaris]|nr:hypothetical protein DFH09DRAFT_1339115 [Mycena vulgaris]
MSCGSEYAFLSLSLSFSSTEEDLDVARDTFYTSSASATPASSLTAPRLFPPALLLPSCPLPTVSAHLCMIIARAPYALLSPASGIKLASTPLDRRSARPLSLPPPSSFAPCVPVSANLQRRRRIAALPR